MFNSIFQLIIKIRNIGVSDNIASRDVKYIHLINMYGFVISLLMMTLILFSISGRYIFHMPQSIVIWELTIGVIALPMFLFTFVLTSKKQFTVARNYVLVVTLMGIMVSTFNYGAAFQSPLLLLTVALSAAVIFPQNERKWMVGIIILCTGVFFIIGTGYELGYLKAYYPIETLAPIDIFNAKGVTFIFIWTGSIFLTLIAHNAAIRAEGQLQDERQIVLDLSNKLRVYLPPQFVESLARGDRDAGLDYKRRKLTVFFSDVKGFTAWTDKLEPEETREILNQYLSEMSRIADKWGGTIDKFIGDAIMIFFGDPEFTNDKDHALRCVKMAMEMQTKMGDLCAEWEDRGHEDPLHIRVGINTGYATVGNFGSGKRLNYTALGSTVNLASRIETACLPDKITVSHSTYSLIKNEIECIPKGMIEVKGFSESVKIYEVAGEKS
jgi:adenylate cyclase